jgi:NADPH:quinone reductase-like Zn-dependent oxidoreductase
MALQGLTEMGKVKAGQSVLMNGAGGGVGTFVIQMARSLGSKVTAVDSAGKLDFLSELGADAVIDYAKDDFTLVGDQYDIIIDVVANRPIAHYKRALSANGKLIIIGGEMSILFGTLLERLWRSSTDGRQYGILPYRANNGLDRMVELFESNKARPVIDRVFPLADTSAAFKYFSENNFKGKVVISN